MQIERTTTRSASTEQLPELIRAELRRLQLRRCELKASRYLSAEQVAELREIDEAILTHQRNSR